MKSSYDIIITPVLTEKSYAQISDKKYTFKVDVRANKYQIKAAIEEVFGVKVDSVHTMQYDGKVRRVGRTVGKTNRYKKAIVKLTADSKTIDFFDNIG
ncbi:MAG: 50S ribosomal protein L23 [Clostridiales bacterium]|nr:50S ribosomal protein L23 [Clostridiales bacterium]